MKLSMLLLINLLTFPLLYTYNVFAFELPTFNFEDVSTVYPEEEFDNEVTGNFALKAEFHHQVSLDDKYTLFFYSFYDEHHHLLKSPHKLVDAHFHDHTLVFDDKASLPDFPVWSVLLLACEDGSPLWVNLFGNGGFYFYGRDPNTNRWTNHTDPNLHNFEHVDSNGTRFYKIDTVEGFTGLYDHLQEQCSALSSHQSSYDDDHEGLDEPPLEFHVKSVRAWHKPDHEDVDHETYHFKLGLDNQVEFQDKSSYFLFHIDDEDKPKFKYPNKVHHLKFNRQVLTFHPDAQLPKFHTWSLLTLYACDHTNPLLVRLHGRDGYVFFSPGQDGKWNNFIANSLKELESSDENGVKVYKYDTVKGFKAFVKGLHTECLQLAKNLCKDQHHTHGALPQKSTLEAKLKLVELDDLSDFLFSSKDFAHGKNEHHESDSSEDEL